MITLQVLPDQLVQVAALLLLPVVVAFLASAWCAHLARRLPAGGWERAGLDGFWGVFHPETSAWLEDTAGEAITFVDPTMAERLASALNRGA